MAPPAPPALDVTVEHHDGAMLVHVEGELDLDGAPELCAAIEGSRRSAGRKHVFVDLTRVGFCDSTGLRALIDAAREVTVDGGRLVAIVPEDGSVRRVIAMTGAEEFLAVTSDRDRVRRVLAKSP
jgi:anti-sigma B factor antagonist